MLIVKTSSNGYLSASSNDSGNMRLTAGYGDVYQTVNTSTVSLTTQQVSDLQRAVKNQTTISIEGTGGILEVTFDGQTMIITIKAGRNQSQLELGIDQTPELITMLDGLGEQIPDTKPSILTTGESIRFVDMKNHILDQLKQQAADSIIDGRKLATRQQWATNNQNPKKLDKIRVL